MNWFARIFGNVGTIWFKGATADGRSFSGDCQVESIGCDLQDVKGKLKEVIYERTGVKCLSVEITKIQMI